MNKRLWVVLPAVVGACACAWLPSVDVLANPLDEHRRSMRTHSQPAYVVAGSIAYAGNDGRIVFSIPSARLLSAGVRSGDQVVITIGEDRPWSAFVAFRDELDRTAELYLQQGTQTDPEPGMTLVVNRDQPGERVVLDASAGGATVGDATSGRMVSIQAIRRIAAK